MKKLQILIPQYKETEAIIKPLLDANVYTPTQYPAGWETV